MAGFKLAPEGKDEAAGVICSFDSKWKELVHDGSISVVFRKKKLTKDSPKWLYVYIAKPVSAITAKMRIVSTKVMSVPDALLLADEGKISVESLENYAESFEELFVIRVGQVEVAKTPLTSDVLKERYRFFPSPNFIRISSDGVKAIDESACFSGAK